MPAPPNVSFATAIEITLPATITGIDASDGAGTNYDLYYKFTAPADSRVIGAWGFTPIADAFVSTIYPYLGPAGAPTQILGIAAANKPIQFPVTPASEYFIKLAKNGNSSPATIDLHVEVAVNGAIAEGNIIVNDDTTGFPTAILSHLLDDTYIAFIKDTASGEAGDILKTSGVIALEEVSTGHIIVYDIDFNQLTDLDFNLHQVKIRTCIAADKFYVGENDGASHMLLYTIDNLGAKSALLETVDTVAIGAECLAAKNDETILYFANRGNGVPIKQWDLVTHVAGADLVAAIAGYAIPDILYLDDDTLIALYYNSSTKDVQAIQYDTTGATLNTYTLGAQTGSTKPRLAYALDNPNSFWVWTHNTSGRSIFRNVKCNDGSVLATRTHQEFEGGAYNATETATPLTRFGHSFSCPFFIMTGTPTPPVPPTPSRGGLYYINPTKAAWHDSYYDAEAKIPDPTIRTALLGE
jgi:hypothetical protein